MALASSSSKISSPSFSSTRGCSRGTIIVPLDFLVPSFGLLIEGVRLADVFAGVLPPCASEEDVLDESFIGDSARDGLEVLGSKEGVCGMVGTAVSVGDAMAKEVVRGELRCSTG